MEAQTVTVLDIPTLTAFFMWCSILSIIIMLLWVLMWFLVPDLIYRIQSKLVKMPRETWDMTMYVFLGTYKLLITVAFILPWIALLIIG